MPDTTTTIVVPCYNEADRLDLPAFLELTKQDGVRVLFVDDGSKDDTLAMLEGFTADHDGMDVLGLEENQGKGGAVRAGLRAGISAGSDIVGFLDADLATPASEMLRIVETLDEREDIDAVLGSRISYLGTKIDRHATRHYSGRVFATIASLALRIPVYDTQCGAKAFRVGPSLEAALEEPFGSAWAFDVELLARLLYDEPATARDRIIELPLRVWTDIDGTSLTWRARISATLDLLRIWRAYRGRS